MRSQVNSNGKIACKGAKHVRALTQRSLEQFAGRFCETAWPYAFMNRFIRVLSFEFIELALLLEALDTL